MIDICKLKSKAKEVRKNMLNMCVMASKGHVTSSLSSIEILVALYYGGILKNDPRNPLWNKRDRFIMSKGQSSPALYTILADQGYFSKKELKVFKFR